jgi:serine/threonine-protein kinase
VANRKLGKYELIERLGRGGMAEVYKAYHANLDRFVAIKVLHTFLSDAPEFKSRFEKEAQSVAKLKHPHIVQVYDFDYSPDDDSFYMVMELIEGPSLKDRMADLSSKGARLPVGEVLRIIYESAGALAYAHSQNMIHRDVKPANLMLEHGKRVVLTDFGIAKILTGQQYTTTGGMVGTPAYMAPEQGMGETGDERSDLYSVGVIMFEALTGRLPYEAETPVAMILKHVNNPVPSACELNSILPRTVDQILGRMLAKKPVDRYSNMNDLIADLQRVRSGEPLPEEKATGQTKPLRPLLPKSALKPEPRNTIVLEKAAIEEHATIKVTPVPALKERDTAPPRRRVPLWGWIGSILLVVVAGIGGLLVNNGRVGGVAILPTETPTLTQTHTATPASRLPPTSVVSRLATESPTVTPSFTATATLTATPTITPSPTLTDTVTYTFTPSPTANQTATQAYVRTATTAACNFNYAIIEQDPENGQAGGFFRINEAYQREITLLNSGNCTWEANTALYFIEGEDFNSKPQIFIRQAVEPGAEVTLVFEGVLPSRGSTAPLSGTWELRTPGQLVIGGRMTISIMVYDPG